jgi:site-specific DNA-adenine methylase
MQYDLFGHPIIKEFPILRIPYQGSKNSIAVKLLRKMLEEKPKAKYFVDLFGGGGSMSFTAAQMGLKVIYNEKQTNLVKFIKYILDRVKKGEKSKFGIFPEDFYNFITREEFIKLKDEDSIKAQFARICYSFGNNQTNYAFSERAEKIKKQGHLYIYDKIDIEGISNIETSDFSERRSFLNSYAKKSFEKILEEKPELKELLKKYYSILDRSYSLEEKLIFTKWLRSTGIKAKEVDDLTQSQMSSRFLTLNSQPQIPTKKMWKALKTSDKIKNIPDHINNLFDEKKIRDFRNLEQLEQLKGLQQLEQLERLQQLEQLQQLQQLQQLEQLEQLNPIDNIKLFNLDYKEVQIETPKNETIVYLDPPYRNTAGYIEGLCHNELDDYFKSLKYKAFMSEYEAPFKSVLEIKKAQLMNNTKEKKTYAIEKLFVNQ